LSLSRAETTEDLPEWVDRRRIGLEIAGRLKLEGIARAILDDLHDDWTIHAWQGDDVVALAKAVAAVELNFTDEERAVIIDAAVDWITADTYEWTNARAAEQYLADLGRLAPGGKFDSVQDDLMRNVEYELEKWAGPDLPANVDWRELDDMLDYANQFTDPGSTFPGYDAATQSLARHRDETRAPETNRTQQTDNSAEALNTKVDQIMRLLGELE
jgi:hypothetical protein